jgi:hypothetical protein
MLLKTEENNGNIAIFSLDPNSDEKSKKLSTKTYLSYSIAYEQLKHPDYIDIIELEKMKKYTEYKIINYDKHSFCFDESILIRRYRSVIFTHPDRQLLSFSFPKSQPSEYFFEKNNSINETIYASEKIEGILLHLFYDYRIKQWEIATKRAIGGVYHLFHYKKKDLCQKKSKVRDLFLDALCIPRKTNFMDITMFDELSKDYNYSFILQHPENRIVFPIVRPTLYLIGVFLTLSLSNVAISISPEVYESWDCFRSIPVIQFPKRFEGFTPTLCHEDNGLISGSSSVQWLKNWYSIAGSEDYNTMGIVARNLRTGDQCVIKNPVYEKMLKWRENSNINTIQYQYLALRRISKTNDFLAFFPKYKSEFAAFFEDYKQFVLRVHGYYMSKYARKEKTQISDKYLYFVDDIHKNVYLSLVNKWYRDKTLEKPKITCRLVFEYFNKMEPEQLLYILNYDQRKFVLDIAA